jgi:hypothetical protein
VSTANEAEVVMEEITVAAIGLLFATSNASGCLT